MVQVVSTTEAAEAGDRCPALLNGYEVAALAAETCAVYRAPAVRISPRWLYGGRGYQREQGAIGDCDVYAEGDGARE